MRILIKSVLVNGEKKTDILIENDVIVRTGRLAVSEGDVDVIYELDGCVAIPSLVDLHCHTRQPGGDEQETLESVSIAAVKGGVTACCSMPNTNPPLDNPSMVFELKRRSKQIGLVDVLPVGAMTVGQQGKELTEMAELKKAGAVAVSEDGKAIKDAYMMRKAMEYAKTVGLPVFLHCEEHSLTEGCVMNEGAQSLRLGLKGAPDIAETIGLMRDLEIASYVGAKAHICHISSERALRIMGFYRKYYGSMLSCETAPHYIVLTDADIEDYNPLYKVNPPLRTARDRKALISGIRKGIIQAIATDHAPHTDWDKELEFDRAPFGFSGIELWLSLMITYLIKPGLLAWQDVIRACSVFPRQVLGLPMAEISEGSIADIVVVDPQKEWEVTREGLASKGKNTPFLGKKLGGSVLLTVKSGKVVYTDPDL